MKNRKNILIFGFLPHWYLGGAENFNKILFSYLENKYNIYEIANYELQTFAQKWAFNDRNNKVKTFLFSSPLKKIVFYDNKIKQEKINDITNKKGFLDNIRRIFDYFEKIPVIKYIFKIIRKILNEILVLFNKMQSFKNNKLMEQFIKKNNIGKVITHFDVYKIYNINFKKIHKNFELIAIVHNNINNYFKHTRTERETTYIKNQINYIDKVIVSNNIEKNILKTRTKHNNIFALNWAVYNKAEISQNIQHIKDKKDIIFVGRLDQKQKNLRALKKIASKINYPIHVYGAGPDKKILANATNIILHGNKTKEELKEIYKKSKLLVLTSNFEGFCYVIGEALSFGIPVICFDTFYSCHETLANDRGFIVKQHDYDTFAQKINLIMNENQQDYYQRCLKIIEYASNNLTIENFATKIAKIID